MTVYFIKPVGMAGPIKIGSSAWPGNRRATLQSWSPWPLEIVAEISGDKRVEGRFHRQFIHALIHGEWFEPVPELVATVSAVQAGCFDTNTLPRYAGKCQGLRQRVAMFKEIDYEYLDAYDAHWAINRGPNWRYYHGRMPAPALFAKIKTPSLKAQILAGLLAHVAKAA